MKQHKSVRDNTEVFNNSVRGRKLLDKMSGVALLIIISFVHCSSEGFYATEGRNQYI